MVDHFLKTNVMSLTIDLKKKVVLVTGVTSGIGAGVAAMFARAGASVAGCGRGSETSAGARAFITQMQTLGASSCYLSVDVTQPEALQEMTDTVVSRLGGIDILVSNAGRNVFEGALDCTEQEWAGNIELNLASHWRLARCCKPHLEKSDSGVIILMTSNHAFSTIPGSFPYNVAKTALTGLVRSLAIEWGPRIRTVGLAPGFIDTPGNQQWFDSFPDPEGERHRTAWLHPVKRIGTVAEIGAWCVFLASEFGGFASGTTYLLDGGRSALMQDSL